MRTTFYALVLAAGGLLVAGHAVAQEGHPLKGSWLGAWEPDAGHGSSLVVVMDWDGENIVGMINPGTHNMAIENATLDPETWTLRMEAERVDDSGNTRRYVLEGEIRNLAFHSRALVGTWRHDDASGTFELQRQP